MLLNVPLGPFVGSSARKLWAPVAWVTLKVRVFPLQRIELNEEEFRPSSQVNICNAETTGTPCACAEATIASAPSD
jgi:hypothetical protein